MGRAAVLADPARIALQILLTGDPLTARRAYEIGLVNDVVPLADSRTPAHDCQRRHSGLAALSSKLDSMALIRKVAADEHLGASFGLELAVGAAVCAMFWTMGAWFGMLRTRPNNLLARRPVFVLVLTYLCLLAMAGALPLHGPARVALWIAAAVIGPYLWFFAYALTDSTSRNPDSYPLQFGTFFPFWVGSRVSFTPIGKGAAFLPQG